MTFRFIVLLGFVGIDLTLGVALLQGFLQEGGLEAGLLGLVMTVSGLVLLLGLPLLHRVYPAVFVASLANATLPLFLTAGAASSLVPAPGDGQSTSTTIFFAVWIALAMDLAMGLRHWIPPDSPASRGGIAHCSELATETLGSGAHVLPGLGLFNLLLGYHTLVRQHSPVAGLIWMACGWTLLLGFPVAWKSGGWRFGLQMAALVNLAAPGLVLLLCLGSGTSNEQTGLLVAWMWAGAGLLRVLRGWSRLFSRPTDEASCCGFWAPSATP